MLSLGAPRWPIGVYYWLYYHIHIRTKRSPLSDPLVSKLFEKSISILLTIILHHETDEPLPTGT